MLSIINPVPSSPTDFVYSPWRGLEVANESLIVAPGRDPLLQFYPVRRFLAGIVPATRNRIPIRRRLALASNGAKIVRNI